MRSNPRVEEQNNGTEERPDRFFNGWHLQILFSSIVEHANVESTHELLAMQRSQGFQRMAPDLLMVDQSRPFQLFSC